MYYKYTLANKPNGGGLIEFIPQAKVQPEGEGTPREEAFRFLGYIHEEDGRTSGYYRVADGVEPVEQPSEINAYSLEKLPEEVAQELLLNGVYARQQRRSQALKMMPPIYAGHELENLFAQVYTDMADLADALTQLVSAMPMTMESSEESSTANLHVKNTLSKFAAFKKNTQAALDAVGL